VVLASFDPPSFVVEAGVEELQAAEPRAATTSVPAAKRVPVPSAKVGDVGVLAIGLGLA